MLKPKLCATALRRSRRPLQEKKLLTKKLPRCCAVWIWDLIKTHQFLAKKWCFLRFPLISKNQNYNSLVRNSMSISCIVRYLIAAMLKPSLCDAALRRSWKTHNQKATQKKATTVLRSVILGFFVYDFDEKRSFLGFLSIKNSHFQLCCVYFFSADWGNAKTNIVRRCVTSLSENGTRQKATQKKATTVLRSSILGNFWKALLRIFQIFERFCSSGGGWQLCFHANRHKIYPPGLST